MFNGTDRRVGERLPKKLLGSVLVLSGILLVLWLLVVARSEYGENQRISDTGMTVEAVQPDSAAEHAGRLGFRTAASPDDESRSSGLFGGAMTVFIILVVMLGAAFLWFRKSDTLYPSYFKELGRHPLGMDQELIVLEANGEVWVLGRTSQSITLLFKCAKESWNHQAQEAHVYSGGFKHILDTFRNNRHGKL